MGKASGAAGRGGGASPYEARPWLARYPSGLPADLEPPAASVLSLFDRTVAEQPEAPAYHYFGRTLTFEEVALLADGLAAGFRDLGVGRGDRVAVFLQNVPQFPLAVVAAWKLGAIVVPVNPMLKASELSHQLGDAGAVLLVALDDLHREVAAGVVASSPVRAVVTTHAADLAGDEAPPGALPSRQPVPSGTGAVDLLEICRQYAGRPPADPGLSAGDVAFLTYTSGTTGPPKGAMNTHGNVVFNAATYARWMDLGREDVVLGVAPLFHITGLVAHLAVAMLVGMPVVLGYRFDAGATLAMVERYRATFTAGSITVFNALMNHPDLRAFDLSSLGKVYSGGAPIAPEMVERFAREVGPYIHNVYGLTETTSPSHAVPFGTMAPVDPQTGALSVGVPVFNTVTRVVDDAGAEVPVGQTGELVTAGPQVVPGYWQRSDETAHALRADGLHTGDVGFMDAGGWFYVVDRRKDMIIASGYKVWPREVEDVLYQHPAVREAAVVGVPDTYRGETVKAFVSLRPGREVDEPELVSFCRSRMAAYKYPRIVEIVDELPKTPTGKILRRQLREPATGG